MNEDMLKEYRVLFNSLSREGIKDNDKFVPNKDYLEQFEYELFKMFYSNQKNRRNRCIKGCGVILFANQNCVCTEKNEQFC